MTYEEDVLRLVMFFGKAYLFLAPASHATRHAKYARPNPR